MNKTKLIERIFSAQSKNEEEVLNQLKKDIKTAKSEGLVDTEQYVIVSDSNGIDIYDKVNKEVTHIEESEGNYNISTSTLKTYPKEGEVVKWVNELNGKELTGKLKSIDGDNAVVTIKGQTKTVPISNLVKVDIEAPKDDSSDESDDQDLEDQEEPIEGEDYQVNPTDEEAEDPKDTKEDKDEIGTDSNTTEGNFSDESKSNVTRVKSKEELLDLKSNKDLDLENKLFFKCGDTDYEFNKKDLTLKQLDESKDIVKLNKDMTILKFIKLLDNLGNSSEIYEKAKENDTIDKIQNAEEDIKDNISKSSGVKSVIKKLSFSDRAKIYIAKKKLNKLK